MNPVIRAMVKMRYHFRAILGCVTIVGLIISTIRLIAVALSKDPAAGPAALVTFLLWYTVPFLIVFAYDAFLKAHGHIYHQV